MTDAKAHLLVRLEAGERTDASEDQALEFLHHNVEGVASEYANAFGNADHMRVMKSESFRDETTILESVLAELDMREGRDASDLPPLLVVDATLWHRIAAGQCDDSFVRDVLVVLERGPKLGVHVVSGLHFLLPGSGAAAFQAVPSQIRDHFRRVTMKSDTDFERALSIMGQVTGHKMPEVPDNAFDSMFRESCSGCGSHNLRWHSMSDFRALHADDDDLVSWTEEMEQFMGKSGRVWDCQDCVGRGVMGTPEHFEEGE
jgi:hypothetical protein